jgi:hypothetical protein
MFLVNNGCGISIYQPEASSRITTVVNYLPHDFDHLRPGGEITWSYVGLASFYKFGHSRKELLEAVNCLEARAFHTQFLL